MQGGRCREGGTGRETLIFARALTVLVTVLLVTVLVTLGIYRRKANGC